MKRSTTCVLLLAFISALPTAAEARDLFVSIDGDDGADGSSWAQAWRTPQHAFEVLGPGDTLSFGDGRYVWGGRVRLQGREDAPIVIQAQHPGRAVFDGGTRIANWQRAPGMRHTWWSTVPGDQPVLLCSEADTRRVLHQSMQPHDCERRLGCWAFDTASRKLYLRTSTGLPPERHVVEVAFEPYGLQILGPRGNREPPRYVTVRGLAFKNYGHAGVSAMPAEHFRIEDCQALQSGYGLELWRSLNTTVRGCEVWATYFQKSQEAAAIMFKGTTRDSLAEDNYVHDARQDGIRAYGGTGSAGTRFVRNLVVRTRNPLFFKSGGLLGMPDHNVVVGGGTFGRTAPNPPSSGANTLVRVANPLNLSPRDLIVNAEDEAQTRFADPAYHDYRLQSDSPFRARSTGPEGLGAFPYEDAVVYVSPGGSDSNQGTSQRQAWLTLARATRELESGQTLYLLPGVYRGPLIVKHAGTPRRPITIRAYGRGRVVIATQGATGIVIDHAPHVEIEGIEVRGVQGPAITLRDSPAFSFSRSVARDSEVGISATRSPRGRVDHALLIENRRAGLELGADSPGWQISNTAFARNQGAQAAVAETSLSDSYFQSNAYDVPEDALLGRWGSRSAAELETWQALTRQDTESIAGSFEFSDAERGDFDVAPGSMLAGAGWLATSIGPGELRLEAPAPKLENLEIPWIGAHAAVVTWETPRHSGRTMVWYGEDPALARKISGTTGPFHSATLPDLEPDTVYYLRVATDWRHPDLPAAPLETDVAPLRDFREIAPHLERLERKGATTGISRMLEFRTRKTPPPGRTLYVSLQGDDTADGRRAETAWKSLFKASQEARPGDEIVIEPGVYEEALVPLSGGATAGRRILYRSASWQPVILSGSNRMRRFALQLRGHRHMTFQGFHFRDHHDQSSGQILLEDMNEDIKFRYCFFDGRRGWTGGVRTLYNSTNQASVEDSAFLQNWRAVTWFFGNLDIRHSVFDVGIYSDVYLYRKGARLTLENSISTSAGAAKSHSSGHLIAAQNDPELRSDFNRFYFQPYDQHHFLFRLGSERRPAGLRVYRNADGLARWQRETGNDRHTRIVEDPAFVTDRDRGSRGKPDPDGPPFWLDAYRLAPESPLRGAGRGGADIGIRFPPHAAEPGTELSR